MWSGTELRVRLGNWIWRGGEDLQLAYLLGVFFSLKIKIKKYRNKLMFQCFVCLCVCVPCASMVHTGAREG